MKRFWFCLLTSLVLCGPAGTSSLNEWSNCGTPSDAATAANASKIDADSVACFDFDAALSGTASPTFRVRAEAASVCLNQDRNSTGGGSSLAIEVCLGNDAISDNVCVPTGLTLTSSGDCEAISTGTYRLAYTVKPAGAEDAQVVVRGIR